MEKITERQYCRGDLLLNDTLGQDLITSVFSALPGGVPDTPDYEATITAETLVEAQKMFYYLTRCPNFYENALDLKRFFWKLINSNYPLKTVLLTLLRMIVTASEKKKENELYATIKGALKK